MEVILFLKKRNKSWLLIEVCFMACQLSPLMFQVNYLNVEESFKNINFTYLWSVVNQQVILGFLVLAYKFICCHCLLNYFISNKREVLLSEGLDKDLTGAVEDDKLRIKLLPEWIVVEILYVFQPSNNFIVPFDFELTLWILSMDKDSRNLCLPFLNAAEQVCWAFDDQSFFLVLVQGGFCRIDKMMKMVFESVLRCQGGFLFGAKDEVPNRFLMSKLHFYDIIWFKLFKIIEVIHINIYCKTHHEYEIKNGWRNYWIESALDCN